jgi:hypothetical protein
MPNSGLKLYGGTFRITGEIAKQVVKIDWLVTKAFCQGIVDANLITACGLLSTWHCRVL